MEKGKTGNGIKIREIGAADNSKIENVIRTCLIEFGADHEGTAWADPDLGRFSEIYNKPGFCYWVAEEENGEILGGAGIGGLTDTICELQKMYCLPRARGTWISHRLMDTALCYAKEYYEQCYLETLENMTAAQRFYEKYGFARVPEPIVETEHFACEVRYLKKLHDGEKVSERAEATMFNLQEFSDTQKTDVAQKTDVVQKTDVAQNTVIAEKTDVAQNTDNAQNTVTVQQTFGQFQLSPSIKEALTLLGYLTPTQIQQEAIPAILLGKNVVGKSQTGSGKTAAFGIPICEQIDWEEYLPQALVLEPTRELAVQVQEEIFQIGRKKRIKAPVVFGGMPVDKQAITLKQRSHIVIGTPGRVIDHMKRRNLNLDQVRMLVIDEADLMLDMGFLEDVEYIIKNTGGMKRPQILLFSATLEEQIQKLIDAYMDSPEYIEIASDFVTAEGIEQMAYQVEQEDKFEAFQQLLMLENPGDAIIFCDTREMVNTLFQKLRRKRIRCGMLHGGMEQRDRLYAISDFRKGIYHYLITTDVAARGIDFPDITHVFNYDFPTKKENYVHRIGRTARNGRTG
ncbi:MAG: GNAT family N-acetyltransferase, partial [Lachnospiraceae bacterium]|nr:GNAT family N-acetyltransferase [Lachnospiraceae bacterium]